MANLFSSWMNNAVDGFAQRVAYHIGDRMGQAYGVLGKYYQGDHRPQLKKRIDPKTLSASEDNVILNFVGLAVDRSVSRLFRGGVKWQLPEGATAQEDYLKKVWDLNKQEIILYQVGLHGAVYGTPYFKIAPDGVVDPFDGKAYPRLIALDPEVTRVKTDPQDMNEVYLYQIRYTIGANAYSEVTHRADVEYKFDQNTGEAVVVPPATRDYSEDEQAEAQTGWVVDSWEQSATYGNQMTLVNTVEWAYDFPPIIHWKNIPSLKSCYGDSDIDDAINVQDKENFVVSNIGKVIKHHAHPKTVGIGFSAKSMEKLDDSPDSSFFVIPSAEAKVQNLEMQSDLASSQAHALSLRQSIFDIAREVDMSSMADKLGALTNFALRVLYTDATDKNDTKRQLYGDAFKELNRRLLILGGFEGEASNPGSIQWGEALIVNVKEEMDIDEQAQRMGLVDKETVYKRYESRYGKSWEDIQAALQKQQEDANQGNADIGSMILRNFNKGQGVTGAFGRGNGQMMGNQQAAEMMQKGNG